MLLFIKALNWKIFRKVSFNTSHVTLYHNLSQEKKSDGLCFNTSHVTLYRYVCSKCGTISRFQYITCYSLSHETAMERKQLNGFQYITCYSLSSTSTGSAGHCGVSIHHMLLFIPFPDSTVSSSQVSIHHMLLFIRRSM